MLFTILLALSGLTLSGVAIYYSVIGLTAIFAAAFWPIVVMGTTLEISKLVAASWLKANWERIPRFMKGYMLTSVIVLMLITSMGIFGFLSKAHNDQNLVSGDVQSKLAIYDEKIKTAKENIEFNRKQLKQMDEAVDQTMGRSTSEEGATKANNIRRSQQRERSALARDIEAQQKLIATLNDEAAPIRAEVRKVEAEVGPIKYIAKLIYGDSADTNLLEKAVTWVIMVIVFVFDPLAVLMLLASQMTWQWYRQDQKKKQEEVEKPKIEEQPLPEPEDTGYVPSPWPFPVRVDPIETAESDSPSKDPENVVPEQPTVTEPETDLDRWNKMLEEAEQAAKEESEKLARKKWKDEHPEDTLKRQERLYEAGAIDNLPWETVEKLDEQRVEEESKKKTAYMIKEQNHQVRKTKED